MPQTKKNVTFPLSVFETAQSKDELEDWLAANDPEFLRNIRKARKDDLDGKGTGWNSLTENILKIGTYPI